jgi:hypothetical protein
MDLLKISAGDCPQGDFGCSGGEMDAVTAIIGVVLLIGALVIAGYAAAAVWQTVKSLQIRFKTRLPEPSYSIDAQLAEQLATRNWFPRTAADVAALDALSREIFETRISVESAFSFDAMLAQFIDRAAKPA